MLMRQVAEAFQSLELTSKRSEMTRFLADLFEQASAEDVDILVYLLRGRLGPPFEAPEFGVAERLILVTLSDAVAMPPCQVEALYKKKGDLGLVAEELLPQERSNLTLRDVYDTLRQVATATGAGAQERKIRLVSDLIKRSGGLEAKYILRMLQGRLRLGVGDATIIDGLSEAAGGDYGLRLQIERAYNLCSDLGFVARTLFTNGPTAVEQIGPRVEKPIMVALAERLPSPQQVINKLGRVEAEPKYDGLRLQLHKDHDRVRFFTRRLEDVTGMFPELASAALRQIRAERAVLDGEAVVYNPETGEYLPFQVTVRRKRKYGIAEMETRYPLRYFAFDLLSVDDRDLTRESLLTRREELVKVLRWRADDPIEVTENIITDDAAELERFFQDQIQRGLEGVVVKRPDSPYQAGQRSFNWVKLKRAYRGELRDTVDVVIVGYLVGKGKRAKFGIGSLLAAVYLPQQDKFRTVTKIGSGLTEVGWMEMKSRLDELRSERKPARVDSLIEPDVWVEPAVVVEVLADEITRSPMHTTGKVGSEQGYALRFPRVVSIRMDKGPEDATSEQEILEMYQMQQARPVEQPPDAGKPGKHAA
ncbi:MAG: ATP-dependent DNA ligase [Chloroflexota bacterium]|nr:MAG: ATP-dependent DNA ligase [Chloroflexota bacterium]